MSFEKTFKSVSYLLVLVGIAALAAADGTPSYIIIALAAAPVSWWVVEVKGRGLGKSPARLVAGILIFFAVMDSIFISGAVLLGLAHLLLLVQVLKLFQPKGNGDYLQMYAISFIHLLVASVLTTDFNFAVFFVVYTVLATWAMLLLNLKKASESRSEEPLGIINRRLFASTSLAISLAFASMAFFFILIPRVGMGLTIKSLRIGNPVSGFSERVNLGDIGRIKKDPRVVMRVEMLNAEPTGKFKPLWRGKTYDYYSNGQWSSSGSDNYEVLRAYGEKIPLPLQVRVKGAAVVKHRVQLEGTDSRIIFVADSPAAVSMAAPYLLMGPEGTIYSPAPLLEGLKYTAYSLAPEREAEYREEPGNGDGGYLQLPRLSQQVRELALKVTYGGKDSYDKARLIEDYLLRNYGYTLELTGTRGIEPVEYFLFEGKKGNCEYFASAMALMLRSIGIPARMLGGFRGGEWNQFGSYYLVRQSNAHTWVEAHLPPVGWLSFDPTPAETEAKTEYPAFIKTFQNMVDALRWKWQSHVIAFDMRDQKMLYFRAAGGVREVSLWGASLREALNRAVKGPLAVKRYPMAALFVAAAAAVMVIILFRRGPGARRDGNGGGTLPPGFFRRYLRIMARKGFRKPAYMTPLEFARGAVTKGGEQFKSTERITDIYYRNRYGGGEINENELREIYNLLDELRGVSTR